MSDFLEGGKDGSTLSERLQRAVRSEAPPPFLEARIRNALRASESKAPWGGRLALLAAAAVLCLGAAAAYRFGQARLSRESYSASVSNRVGALMRVGLGDHIHCSVFRRFPKNAPRMEDLAGNLGSQYGGLIPILRERLPEEYRLMIAHECRYRGRAYIHVSLKSDSRLLSLVIARKNDGESFEAAGLAPAVAQSGIPFYRAGAQPFEIASFESAGYLVYFISDLDERQNMRMMLAIAPEVKELLRELEA